MIGFIIGFVILIRPDRCLHPCIEGNEKWDVLRRPIQYFKIHGARTGYQVAQVKFHPFPASHRRLLRGAVPDAHVLPVLRDRNEDPHRLSPIEEGDEGDLLALT